MEEKNKLLKRELSVLWQAYHAAMDVIDTSPQDVEMPDGDQELHDSAREALRSAQQKLKKFQEGNKF